ncbi:MAG: 30S ribosomal protein S12 methylthiotransferase RimO [Acidimicrobiales bacterium]|jgi:ribosomal protein S12 methylthiotransferase|nr:30S ribosomal protein S12 methylthiotransferase RimO [Actinomycetes bacterium]MDP6287178.1 30S ribosomal protein S12 methylthiotransferase RimO [Acidimicrobiales bacterium]MDP6911378.1 30S ribosomal protein S12 methylthiotransferase RimO [Acidimicrobiales bacterium]HJM73601.1 30S ribosomal protein S12 methylthiotransferase RimO [Acidimicrobiales bacterium]HJP25392.1 30S ribosomal protein S12 methylthiotransferase RimO [Acidimicrobiales bacterium]
MTGTYHLVTLGCPKNQVDSDKLAGTLAADGMQAVNGAGEADLIVVNTCAFVDEARRESIDTVLALADKRRDGARLVVTGCMAERYGDELAEALPEVDRVAGFGVPVTLGPKPSSGIQPETAPLFDLLNLPRPASDRPWAYVKVAEGCDRACGFCAIPTFRGPQRSRSMDDVLAEVDALDAREIILVAQDLAAFGRDQGVGDKAIVPLVEAVAARVDRVRLLYLYPSELTDRLVDAVCVTGVPYFDLSLQHVSSPLMRRMRRWGDGGRFLERIEAIRAREPEAAFRSNFIVGYPGETEEDHDALLDFVVEAQVDWCGFFAYSAEEGTYAADLDAVVDPGLMAERLGELTEIQDRITADRRDELIGRTVEVLVDEPGVGRTHREAPEIDGVVSVPEDLAVGTFQSVTVTGALGPDLEAMALGPVAA